MAPAPGFEFRRKLRALDADALERFVADLWRARGWAVQREGGTLVVEHPTLGDRRTIEVSAVPRWRRGPARPAPADADIAVVNRPVSDGSASILDAHDLYEMVRYGVDPATRSDLCRSHLDRPGTLVGWAIRNVPPGAPVRIAAASVAVVLLLAAAAGLAFLPGDQVGPQDSPGGVSPAESEIDRNGSETLASASWPLGGVGFPPGLAADGLTDPGALTSIHVRRVRKQPYELTLTVREFQGGRPVGSYEERIAVRSNWTFASSIDVSGERRADHPVVSAVEMYSSGNGVFVHVGPNRSMDRQAALRASAGSVTGMANRVERYLLEALSMNDSAVVETSQIGDTTFHRVNGTGTGPDGVVENVSVVVTAGGTIHRVRAERPVPGTDRSVVVALDYRFGSVDVAPPPWLGNESATVGRNLPLSKR